MVLLCVNTMLLKFPKCCSDGEQGVDVKLEILRFGHRRVEAHQRLPVSADKELLEVPRNVPNSQGLVEQTFLEHSVSVGTGTLQ